MVVFDRCLAVFWKLRKLLTVVRGVLQPLQDVDNIVI